MKVTLQTRIGSETWKVSLNLENAVLPEVRDYFILNHGGNQHTLKIYAREFENDAEGNIRVTLYAEEKNCRPNYTDDTLE